MYQHEKVGLHPHNNQEKLDRVLVNWPWRSEFQNAIATTLPPIAYDHSPILLWPNPKLKGKYVFKYEAMWEEREDYCKEIVKEGWTRGKDGEKPTVNFINRTKSCKLALKKWHQAYFKKADLELAQLNSELETLLNKNTEEDEEFWLKISSLRNQIDQLRKQQEIYWAQRSRIKWLQHGDRNSSFFHASTVQRRDRNRLFRLKNDLGNWVEGQGEIEDLVQHYFQQVYKSDGPINFQNCSNVV
ncbi:hypothetical protein SESBI_15733 [Sesbania bispinosa]|nr:hypothetical protein SESBI_15733 [Sesbania bispinosa]